MSKFRKKPVVILAFRFGYDRPPKWWKEAVDAGKARVQSWEQLGEKRSAAVIKTLEGEMWGHFGDWIIRGVKGELCPCKPDIFEATYEPV